MLITWDAVLMAHHSFTKTFTLHLTAYVFVILLSALAILWHDMKGDANRYIEGLIRPNRSAMIGLSAFMIGGLHLLEFGRVESVYLLMGYAVGLLAYCETAMISNDFRGHFSSGENPTSRQTVLSLLANRIIILGTVFVLSAMGLYMALMGVVGFTTVWSVLIFTCILLLILAILVKMRKI